MRCTPLLILLVSLLLPGTSVAQAQALAGNLGEPLAGTNSALLGQWFATPFVTDESPHTLSAIRFERDD